MDRTIVNGFDVGALFETVETISEDPCIAAFKFRARNRWVGGGENRTTIDGYYAACEELSRDEPFELVNDEPSVLLGTDTAPNPTEYVLHALAGCMTTSLVAHAAARGVTVEEVDTHIFGDLDVRGFLGIDESVRSGFERIAIEMRVKADAPEETIRELCEIARARSPVFDIVTNRVPVALELVARPAGGEDGA